MEDDPEKPLVTCDEDGIKYLLSVSMIEGTNLTSAAPGSRDQSVNWAVDLKFDGQGTEDFSGDLPEPSTTRRSSSRSSWTAR